MNQESQERLEVSKVVVDQLNSLVRNSAEPVGYGQAPRAPTPPPNPPRIAFSGQED
jgi:hypothetical protein